MIERAIMLKLLEVLENYGTYAAEDTIHTDMNMAATNRIVTSTETLAHLNYAAEKGWAEWTKGALENRLWHLTPAGKAARRDLEHGG
jgi:hypothetical protein